MTFLLNSNPQSQPHDEHTFSRHVEGQTSTQHCPRQGTPALSSCPSLHAPSAVASTEMHGESESGCVGQRALARILYASYAQGGNTRFDDMCVCVCVCVCVYGVLRRCASVCVWCQLGVQFKPPAVTPVAWWDGQPIVASLWQGMGKHLAR